MTGIVKKTHRYNLFAVMRTTIPISLVTKNNVHCIAQTHHHDVSFIQCHLVWISGFKFIKSFVVFVFWWSNRFENVCNKRKIFSENLRSFLRTVFNFVSGKQNCFPKDHTLSVQCIVHGRGSLQALAGDSQGEEHYTLDKPRSTE